MRVWRLKGFEGPESLVLGEEPAPPSPGPGQIRVAMRAGAINYRDLMTVRGDLRAIVLPDLVPCSDGAGEVIETGPGVWRCKVGDRVALTFNPTWIGGPFRSTPGAIGRGGGLHGTMQDEVVVSQDEAVRLPDHLSFAEGATLPCAGVTAWHALTAAVPLQPGMTVLTEGAGGVSVFAIQFAKLFGARVIATTSSPERAARLHALGADAVIDYKAEPEWQERVKALTGGQGVDLAIEVGGAGTIERAIAATRVGGRIALVGLLTGRPSTLGGSVDFTPTRVGSRDDFEAMNRAIAFHALKPMIDRSFLFEQLPDALRHLRSGAQFGKIAIAF